MSTFRTAALWASIATQAPPPWEAQPLAEATTWVVESEEAALRALASRTQRELAELGVGAQVSARVKSEASIAAKMARKQVGRAGIHDRLALRAVVGDVADCYRALDWIHARYAEIPGEFDDYVARPKANGYQSLHTAVWVPELGAVAEFQVRTWEMHQEAESGRASHAAYKAARAAEVAALRA